MTGPTASLTARWSAVTIDCLDPARAATFWHLLLDLPVLEPGLPGWQRLGGRDTGLVVNFQPGSTPKTGKNRLHLDVTVDDIDAAVTRILDLGGTSRDERHDYPEGVVVVMADPEGNEFCIVQYY
jgi:predicted enzyme related to lactoylglutathione lyase